MAVLSTLPPVACCRRRALQRRDLCALMAAWFVVAAHLAAAPEPATPPAAAQGGGAAPAPLEAMLRGDATADFGDAGPVAVKLPQRAARTGDVWCGDVWCAVLLPEHFQGGNQVSPSGKGARPSPYGGKLAPIAVPAKEHTGGTLPAFGVLRGLVFGSDYVFGCRDPGSGTLKALPAQGKVDDAWRAKDPARGAYPGKGVAGKDCGVRTDGSGPGLAVVLTARGWAKLLRPEHGGLGAAELFDLPSASPKLLFMHEPSVFDSLRRQEAAAKQRASTPALKVRPGPLLHNVSPGSSYPPRLTPPPPWCRAGRAQGGRDGPAKGARVPWPGRHRLARPARLRLRLRLHLHLRCPSVGEGRRARCDASVWPVFQSKIPLFRGDFQSILRFFRPFLPFQPPISVISGPARLPSTLACTLHSRVAWPEDRAHSGVRSAFRPPPGRRRCNAPAR